MTCKPKHVYMFTSSVSRSGTESVSMRFIQHRELLHATFILL